MSNELRESCASPAHRNAEINKGKSEDEIEMRISFPWKGNKNNEHYERWMRLYKINVEFDKVELFGVQDPWIITDEPPNWNEEISKIVKLVQTSNFELSEEENKPFRFDTWFEC